MKDYARRQVTDGTPAIHVLHEIVDRMEELDHGDTMKLNDDEADAPLHVTEPDAFDALGVAQDVPLVVSDDADFFERIDSSNYVNYNSSVIRDEEVCDEQNDPLQDFRRGRMMLTTRRPRPARWTRGRRIISTRKSNDYRVNTDVHLSDLKRGVMHRPGFCVEFWEPSSVMD